MSDRSGLLDELASMISDYREGEINRPTPARVDRWIRQFPENAQVPMLRELNHVLKETYYTGASVLAFIESLIGHEKIVGADPIAFWRASTVLNIQRGGHSQNDMLEILETALTAKYGLTLADCAGTGPTYVYIDDGLYSGSRITDDLRNWIEKDAPGEASVIVIVIAGHTYGEFITKRRLRDAAELAGKSIQFNFLATRWFENRKARRDASDVLWPTELPDDEAVGDYLAIPSKFPFEPRPAGGPLGVFSSEPARQLLERELLIVGARIREAYANPTPSMRPLGYSSFGLGFGTLVVMHRNCPNNAPLPLWWGLDEWYPLFPRKVHG